MPKTIRDDQEVRLTESYTVEGLLEQFHAGLEDLDIERLHSTEAYVIAHFMGRLSVDDCRAVLRKVPDLDASAILAEMDAEDSAEVIAAMREWRALKLLEEFDPDDAADVMNELEEPDRVRLLRKLSPETAQQVRALLKYAPDTAGGVMTPSFIWVYDDMTVDQGIEQIRRVREDDSRSSYVYVIDRRKRLKGVFSLKALLLAKPEAMVEAIMVKELKGVLNADEDKEAVALAMAELNLFDLPVVDAQGRLLGIVEHDDVIDIIQEEATEDFQKLVGAGGDETIHDKVRYSVTKRGPWLIVNLLTAVIGAFVIARYQDQIENLSILAVLMPAIASLGGNAGSQTLAVAIRSLAVGDIERADSRLICIKEALKGILNGIIVGVVAGALIGIFTKNQALAGVFFFAMILNMGMGGLAGAFIPLMLKRLGFDPAQSSSIFLTAVTDVFGFFIFLSLGAWLLF